MMRPVSTAAGLAALSLCESILLSLTENQVIDAVEAKGIVEDAARAHREAVALSDGAGEDHAKAAKLLEEIMHGGNSVRYADRLEPE
jgi:hypothetical protein